MADWDARWLGRPPHAVRPTWSGHGGLPGPRSMRARPGSHASRHMLGLWHGEPGAPLAPRVVGPTGSRPRHPGVHRPRARRRGSATPDGGNGERQRAILGIIGGSGLYDLPGLTDTRWVTVDTPWGCPATSCSAAAWAAPNWCSCRAMVAATACLPEVNYRANIAALKAWRDRRCRCRPWAACVPTCRRAPSWSWTSSSTAPSRARRASSPPGWWRIIDGAPHLVAAGAHVGRQALRDRGVPHVVGGTYLAMEGPQFSTLAESRAYRSWNCSVIGMTNMPEAKLAREAEPATARCRW